MAKKNFLDIIKKQRASKKKTKFAGTLLDYLELVKENPDIIKLAHKRLYESIYKQGGKTLDVDSEGYRPIFNGDKLRVYDYFSSDFYGMESVTNKLLVLGSYTTRISGNSATVTPSANIFITDVSNVQKAGTYIYFNTASNTHHPTWTVCQQAMWTPGSTSAYDVKLLCNNASEGGEVQFYGVSGVAWTSFILIEIEA